MNDEKEIYRTENLPVFQNRMFLNRPEALACPRGDVSLVQNLRTGLVYNRAFKTELMKYDSDYQNEQAFSGVFRGHLDEVTTIVQRYFCNRTIIEVGCGKGHFIEHLLSLGFSITGLDPAYEGNNPNIIKASFDPSLGLAADGIILRHVLEHVSDPLAFLTSIYNTNGGKGKVYIEVPCFESICRQRAWFDIYYEHVNYFQQNDFLRMFDIVYEIGHVFGGQYLYVVADLSTLHPPTFCVKNRVGLPSDFLEGIERFSTIIKTYKMKYGKQKSTAIWGGASKGVIFSLFMQRAGTPIDIVIDINPTKQGKYLPASGLIVQSPQKAMKLLEPGTPVFVMNPNYLDEIISQSGNQYRYVKVQHDPL